MIISNEMVLCMLILFSIKILQQQSLEGFFHFRNIYWHLQDSLREFPLIPYILTPSDCHTNRFFNLKAQLTNWKLCPYSSAKFTPLANISMRSSTVMLVVFNCCVVVMLFINAQSSCRSLLKTLNLAVRALSLNFLHVFTLFVIDIHQIMLISLFPTPFGHFQFLGSAGRNPKLILTLCLIHV